MNSKYPFHFSRAGSRCRRFHLAIALLLSLIASTPARATERTWDGSARGNGWNDIGNWAGTGAPAVGDDLRFPAGALQPSNNNNFPVGTSFNVLTYAGAGYTASGNEIGLTGGIVVSHGVGNTSLNLPIDVGASQTFAVSLAGANLYLNDTVDLLGSRTVLTFDGAGQAIVVGNISDSRVTFGGGTIHKNGTGTLYVLQHLTLGGPTIVNGGTLIMDGRTSNSAVTVNASATLRGTGKVGGLTVNSGGTVSPGQSSPDILDSLGDVALNAGSTFNVRLNGTSAGLNYDQLKVQGTVTLGGTLNVTAGFVAAVGDSFTLIDNDSDDDVVGTFAGLPKRAILMINGRPFQISYGGRGTIGGGLGRDVNDVTLEAVPALSVWDGGGNENKFWSEPLNWVGDVVPMPGDDIQFSNAGSETLIANNDFPAGRVFGSMIFGGGRVLIGGNAAEFTDVRLAAPGTVDVHIPVGLRSGMRVAEVGTMTMHGSVAMRANQTFRGELSGSSLAISGDITAEDHQLTVDGAGTVLMSGAVSGTGELVKNGSGFLYLSGTNTLPLTTVNAGVLNTGGRIMGLILVNAGGTLGGGECCIGDSGVQDVDVLGGTLAPASGLIIYGKVRMLAGARFVHNIFDQGANGIHSTYALPLNQPIELADGNLIVHITPNMDITPGREFTVIAGLAAGAATGSFNGLPEGTRFVLDGHAFTVRYHGGANGNSVTLVAGAPFVWDGGGSGNVWGTPANWEADLAPLPDSTLVFPANVSKLGMINAFDAGTSFRSLTFGGPSYLLVGNSFQITEGIYNDVDSGDTTIGTDFVAFGSFTSRVSSASRLLLEGGVTGNSSWRKTGTGTLRLTGTTANSQSFMSVAAGELELDKTPGVDAISMSLQIGDGTNDVRVTLLADHQIADSASVTIRNRARLDLNGNEETIHSLQGDGTVALDGRPFPGGAVIRSSRLTVTQGSFTGAIVGDGGLTKIGSSSALLTLFGNNTYSGLTILSGGTLAVEGTQPDSPIRLNDGLLRGRGQVGTITGNLGGIVQPGFSGAAFQNRLHSRDVVFNSTTTFRPLLTSVDPGFENSQLRVTGAVSLGGCALDIELLFVPTAGRSFTILDNDGADPVAGSFAGLPEGAQFTRTGLTWRITYAGGDGNDVALTLLEIDFHPTITSITVDSDSVPGFQIVRITAIGVPRAIYDLQTTANLSNWTPSAGYTANSDGNITINANQPLATSRQFYRLKLR